MIPSENRGRVSQPSSAETAPTPSPTDQKVAQLGLKIIKPLPRVSWWRRTNIALRPGRSLWQLGARLGIFKMKPPTKAMMTQDGQRAEARLVHKWHQIKGQDGWGGGEIKLPHTGLNELIDLLATRRAYLQKQDPGGKNLKKVERLMAEVHDQFKGRISTRIAEQPLTISSSKNPDAIYAGLTSFLSEARCYAMLDPHIAQLTSGNVEIAAQQDQKIAESIDFQLGYKADTILQGVKISHAPTLQQVETLERDLNLLLALRPDLNSAKSLTVLSNLKTQLDQRDIAEGSPEAALKKILEVVPDVPS